MKIIKLTAVIGTASQKHTYNAVLQFMQKLQAKTDIDFEIIRLSEYDLKTCIGCKACFDKGEEHCPLKDDRNIILKKLLNSDGVVFASPNYSFHVSGLMKVFLDRFGWVFHRPQFFGKTFTSIVTEGVYGGKKIVKYFNFIANGLGFNVVKGIVLKTREPINEKVKIRNEIKLNKLSNKFHTQLMKNAFPKPSLIDLLMFRMARSGIKRELNEQFRDYTYYKQKGWFESDFFYPVKLSTFMKLSGKFFDTLRI